MKMLKRGIIISNLLVTLNLFSQTSNFNSTIIVDYIDNDNIKDTLSYVKQNDFIIGEIHTINVKLNFKYNFEENLDTNIDVPERGCLSFVTSGTGMGKVEEIEFYNFDDNISNWIHTKSIIISNNFNNGQLSPTIEFSYHENDFETINDKKIKFKIIKPNIQDLTSIIKQAKLNKVNKYKIIEYIFNFPIDSKNVKQYNDLAFYIQKDDLSLYILEIIIKKFPTRTVAYLNLADSYYILGNGLKAKENYKKYVKLMKDQKRNLKKIPKYVFERIK